VVVVMVLVALLLSSFLAGCMRVETQLDFSGPGRVHLRHRLQPIAGTPFPFQRRLAEALAAAAPPYQVDQQGASTVLFSPLLTPGQALDSLRQTVEAAAALGGLSLPAPALKWQETNWLLGVQQHIQITLDLQTLSPGSGLDLRLRLSPLARGAVRRAFPQSVRSVGGPQALIWPLQLGEINTLEIRCWRWSPLGLGALLIAVGLLLVVQLQRMRVRLGMGLPELPA
jgi:hypothetical protein